MRRIGWMVLWILVFVFAAQAEVNCVCNKEKCICFIQLGDGGPAVDVIQEALIEQGYLSPQGDVTLFDAGTVEAVKAFQRANRLEETGTMNDETLTLLLWGVLPDEMDLTADANGVWIPTDGGIRHHKRAGCCQMYDPRLVSRRNALAMDMQPCGRCKPTGLNSEY